ncbi:MAG: hypothetical protein ABI954_14830 [Pyrinomonadaceae bacterium]
MQQTIKNVVLWNYGRTAWQYDILCILILGFIFLTPPDWFSNGKERTQLVSVFVTRLIVSANDFSPDLSESSKLQRVRELSGNKNANIVGWREKKDDAGRLTSYEIDVR